MDVMGDNKGYCQSRRACLTSHRGKESHSQAVAIISVQKNIIEFLITKELADLPENKEWNGEESDEESSSLPGSVKESDDKEECDSREKESNDIDHTILNGLGQIEDMTFPVNEKKQHFSDS
ncbi:hypothetical protein KIL84_019007 [Mauremys mutica]|uniref:Uncharacterized protein n=1 Tax=Mauremys mutica TaxID=74926 RepID=A0A9D3XUC7_9SAUR|nr:hypothetical protein KIL84_019007 [Mauremys mutica]